MQSGSPLQGTDITSGQAVYDTIVEETGCSRSKDTLECLRTVPSETLFGIFDASPDVFNSTQVSLLPVESSKLTESR